MPTSVVRRTSQGCGPPQWIGSLGCAVIFLARRENLQQQRWKDKLLFTSPPVYRRPPSSGGLSPLQARSRRLLDRQGLHGGVQEHLSRALPVPEAGHLRRANGQFAQGGQWSLGIHLAAMCIHHVLHGLNEHVASTCRHTHTHTHTPLYWTCCC